MYDNIGEKIKGLAKFFAIVLGIGLAILGGYIMSIDEELILPGLIVFIVGPLIAWISSWLIYGFGELIEKTSAIEYAMCGTRAKTQEQRIYNKIPQTDDEAENERLRKLELLRVQGLITEEEYQQAVSKK